MYVCLYVCLSVCMYDGNASAIVHQHSRRDFSYKPTLRRKNYSFSNRNGLIYACVQGKRFYKNRGKKPIRFQIKTDTCGEDHIYNKVSFA